MKRLHLLFAVSIILFAFQSGLVQSASTVNVLGVWDVTITDSRCPGVVAKATTTFNDLSGDESKLGTWGTIGKDIESTDCSITPVNESGTRTIGMSSSLTKAQFFYAAEGDSDEDEITLFSYGEIRVETTGFYTGETKRGDIKLVYRTHYLVMRRKSGPLNDLSGTVKAVDNTNICAMVLASGHFMFSCNSNGVLSLTDLPRAQDGTVKRQIYADGFFPKVDILTGSSNETVVMTRSGACPNYNASYNPGFVPGSAGKHIYIAGKVLLQNSQTPICAMVLANGQHMFSCDGSGSYTLKIPLDTNGQFKLQVYADGFAPTIQTYDEFKTTNNVRMAYATQCQ